MIAAAWAFVGVVIAAEPIAVSEGVLARVGGTCDGAAVVRIEMHPEFERYWLEDSARRSFVAELTRSDGVHEGLCSAHGLVLYPRPELVEGELSPITVQPWCAVLEGLSESEVHLGGRTAPLAPPPVVAARRDPWWVPGLVAACGGLAWATFFWTARREMRSIASVVGLAALVRWVCASPMLFNGAGAGYEKLLLAWGEMRGAPYGPGYPAWMWPGRRLAGESFAAVSDTNLLFSALTAGVMFRLAGALAPRDWPESRQRSFAWMTGGVAMFLPVAVLVSRSEAMHVSAVAFGVLAVALAAEAGTGSTLAGFGALTAWFAAFQTRPDLGVAALPVAAFAWSGRGRWFSAAMAGMVGATWIFLRAPELLHSERVATPTAVLHALVPRAGVPVAEGGFQLFLHAAFTPAAWWGAAALGMLTLPMAVRWRALGWVAVSLPFIAKVYPLADAVRLQLFAQYGWALLVAAGLLRLGPRLGACVGVVTALAQLYFLPLHWANHEEFTFLRDTVATLPSDTVVRSEAYGHRNDAFIRVMRTLGPARWVGTTGGDTGNVSLLYRSVGEPEPKGEPVFIRELVRSADVDVALPPGRVVIGFYRPESSVPTASTGQDSAAN